MRDLNINVMAKDIRDGKRNSTDMCPVALATKRRCCSDDVSVDYDFVRVGDAYYETPEVFIAAFDARKHVRPSRFALKRAL